MAAHDAESPPTSSRCAKRRRSGNLRVLISVVGWGCWAHYQAVGHRNPDVERARDGDASLDRWKKKSEETGQRAEAISGRSRNAEGKGQMVMAEGVRNPGDISSEGECGPSPRQKPEADGGPEI